MNLQHTILPNREAVPEPDRQGRTYVAWSSIARPENIRKCAECLRAPHCNTGDASYRDIQRMRSQPQQVAVQAG